ncbi:MAG: reactive intermediate/imine deaminase [Bacteroidetes bacterium HGW-Bacteroidetes-16]|jgi:2-iminobutanoate/2-iminopropanoate deaminase|nr:MAG: reactive intermediate/imine deaminase [Bacteroidetes bacterium HGW-Bacteroidetes-16]
MKRVIFTNNAPAPIGPYSQAIENNGMLFISGQVPIDPATGKIVEGGVAEQTRQVMENIKAIVKAADFGNDLSNMLKCTIYLSDMSLFVPMNEVYGTYFPTQPPARATIAVKGLPLGALVEIEAVAMR